MAIPGSLPSQQSSVRPGWNRKVGQWENMADQIDTGTGMGKRGASPSPPNVVSSQAHNAGEQWARTQESFAIPDRQLALQEVEGTGTGEQARTADQSATPLRSFARPNETAGYIPFRPSNIPYTMRVIGGIVDDDGNVEKQWSLGNNLGKPRGKDFI